MKKSLKHPRLCKLVGGLLALAMSAALCLNFVPEAQARSAVTTASARVAA